MIEIMSLVIFSIALKCSKGRVWEKIIPLKPASTVKQIEVTYARIWSVVDL